MNDVSILQYNRPGVERGVGEVGGPVSVVRRGARCGRDWGGRAGAQGLLPVSRFRSAKRSLILAKSSK